MANDVLAIENVSLGIEAAYDSIGELHKLKDIVNNTNYMDEHSVKLARIATESILNNLGIEQDNKRNVFVSIEGYQDDNRKLCIAIENAFIDGIKFILKKIKEAFEWVWNSIANLFKSKTTPGLDIDSGKKLIISLNDDVQIINKDLKSGMLDVVAPIEYDYEYYFLNNKESIFENIILSLLQTNCNNYCSERENDGTMNVANFYQILNKIENNIASYSKFFTAIGTFYVLNENNAKTLEINGDQDVIVDGYIKKNKENYETLISDTVSIFPKYTDNYFTNNNIDTHTHVEIYSVFSDIVCHSYREKSDTDYYPKYECVPWPENKNQNKPAKIMSTGSSEIEAFLQAMKKHYVNYSNFYKDVELHFKSLNRINDSILELESQYLIKLATEQPTQAYENLTNTIKKNSDVKLKLLSFMKEIAVNGIRLDNGLVNLYAEWSTWAITNNKKK